MGDVGFLIEDLFKKSAWQMSGSGFQIIFVGSKEVSLFILPLFFDGPVVHEEIGQVFTFEFSRKTRKWIDGGCDLVIYQLSRIHPFWPQTAIRFTVPQHINQMITYPDELSTLLGGNRLQGIRNEINKCRKAGYKWRFSRSHDDFEFFYESLYVPFMKARHGDHANISSHSFLWDMCIKEAGGGLVLVTLEDNIIAGAVCFMADEVCYIVVIGVLVEDKTSFQKGVNAYVFWCVMEWGKEQGAKHCDLGVTVGWRSDNVFQWKTRWKSKVIRKNYPYQTYKFSANRISPVLREKINTIGFICESREGFYSLILDNSNTPLTESDLAETIKRTQKEGLCGVCVIAPEARPRFYQ